MNLADLWLALLGFLLAGYFVLGGADYGVQMLAGNGRARLLGGLGPFYFGNEVWLVGALAVLIGAFPRLEGSLLPGFAPLFVPLVAALALGKAGVQLRGRAAGGAGRRFWTVCVVAGGVIPAAAFGMIFGLLLTGLPLRADGGFDLGWAMVAGPFVLACGLALTAVFAAHGLMFARLRVPGRAPARPGPVLAVAAVAVAGAALLGVGTARPTQPGAAVALAAAMVAVLGAAWWAARRGRAGWAFAATGVAAALPVVLLGAATHPYVLLGAGGTGMTVAEGAADEASLAVLSAFGLVVLPLVLAVQAWTWWRFRRPAEGPAYL
ncbi:cytochrome d ubiquinol oxidase subunit II [Nonomuraea sp. NPDC050310]|uniref:cytochrome d ubiquinol oxidase subunit II n=1 Tax=Nonomuraea sp. NPDC050310 TaxID=3154935 RepID=UPI00341068D7